MLRWPTNLRDAVKASAKTNGRSINSEVVWQLAKALGVEVAYPGGDKDGRDFTQFKLRIPAEQLAELHAAEGRNNRSVCAELLHRAAQVQP
jgi:hypothetical protein